MISYPELYELLRKEKYNEQLGKLPKAFFREVAAYFEEKRKIANKSSELFEETIAKTKKQLENAITIIKEIVTRRQKKIINMALIAAKTGISKRDSENMLENERELFEEIIKRLEKEEARLEDVISGQHQEKDLKNSLLRFTQDTGEFLGPDEKKLGPFRQGDIANLPKKVAEILINAGKAQIVEEE